MFSAKHRGKTPLHLEYVNADDALSSRFVRPIRATIGLNLDHIRVYRTNTPLRSSRQSPETFEPIALQGNSTDYYPCPSNPPDNELDHLFSDARTSGSRAEQSRVES